ncbi:histidine--tRNA ligase [Buchnera aphidicola (Mollitrichosiphum nigrofasciatum)]|uniref:histidine--tRNA ligase n=1 Tax=Buchnera aphidicola TaxID=9 RepID=UPI0031B83E7C
MSKIQSLRGMNDILPKNLYFWWCKIENVIKEIFTSYCFNEIRTPILEQTNLFNRTIGQDTDINKEMYSFNDKNNFSITLRPESTASCVRSVIENDLLYEKILKLWYYGPMFRYERPQKGRFRQFYQIGAEIFGLEGSEIELEILLLINRIWKKLNVCNFLTLEINSIGFLKERIKYIKDLKNFFKKNIQYFKKANIHKFKFNSLRILDSKNNVIKKILSKAPLLKDYLGEISINNFNNLCIMLKKFNIPYNINYNLVRGLDYYNNIVFEWKTKTLGTQDTVCSGGRYDTLFKQLGNKDHVPAIGFAIGMERLVMLYKNIKTKKKKTINIFICFIKNRNKLSAIKLSEYIHNIFPNLSITIHSNNYLFNQKKNISKFNIHLLIFIGDKERRNNYITVKICKQNQRVVVFSKNIYFFIKNFFK